MEHDDRFAGFPDEATTTMTIAEIAADRTHVRENFWLLAPDELNNWERCVLNGQLLDYLRTVDPGWFSQREVELMLELHNYLRAWLEEDQDLGETLGPSFRRVT